MEKITEAIKEFAGRNNKHGVAFLGSFVAFDKKGEIKDDADRIFAFGEKGLLKIMMKEFKDVVKNEEDEDGFVNV